MSLKNLTRKIGFASALATTLLGGCEPDVEENITVVGMYAGMEATASSNPKSVSLRSKNNYVTLFAVDDSVAVDDRQNGFFEENEMWTEVHPSSWRGEYDPENVRRGFVDIGPYLSSDSVEAVHSAVMKGNQ